MGGLMPFGFRRRRGFDRINHRGRAGRMSGRGIYGPGGPPTNCICSQCGLVVPREPGIPCFQRNCLKCGSLMTRQFLKAE